MKSLVKQKAATQFDFQGRMAKAHDSIAIDVRDAEWESNCAGEIFLADESQGVRIGHFQGDARLAGFVVAAHLVVQQSAFSDQAIGGQLNPCGPLKNLNQRLFKVHALLSKDIRHLRWKCGDDGEVFAAPAKGQAFRIGTFQGDKRLAKFVVRAHQAVLQTMHKVPA